jgi:hypothetical protein
MSEEQRPYLSDREARERFTEAVLNDPVISNHFRQAYMDDPNASGSYLEWCWEHRRALWLERLEAEIKDDHELKTRLALIYAWDHEDEIPEKPFCAWAAERLADERTPEHAKAWEGA